MQAKLQSSLFAALQSDSKVATSEFSTQTAFKISFKCARFRFRFECDCRLDFPRPACRGVPTGSSIVFGQSLLGGSDMPERELVAAVHDVALIADEYDDRIVDQAADPWTDRSLGRFLPAGMASANTIGNGSRRVTSVCEGLPGSAKLLY